MTQKAYERLANFPTLAEDLALAISEPPFPSNYQPKVIEVFFDEFPVYTWENGETVFILLVPKDSNPEAVEIAIDGELALVILGTEVILNRLDNLAILNSLKSSYAKN
jgi:hypothetical protein